MEKLVTQIAIKVTKECTIIDFTKMIVEAVEKGLLIPGAAEMILNDLKNEYNKFIVGVAEKEFEKLFIKHATKIIEERKEKEKKEVKLTEEYEIEPLEKQEDEDDLEYTIKNDIYIKNVNILQTQGKYPEEQTENYWMLGIDINTMSEGELQTLSIFDRDFW